MSIKSTKRIKHGRVTRARALEILLSEIPLLPNDTLGHLMDTLADSEQSVCSKFDNFIVSDMLENDNG
jgi:hypothetical protein